MNYEGNLVVNLLQASTRSFINPSLFSFLKYTQICTYIYPYRHTKAELLQAAVFLTKMLNTFTGKFQGVEKYGKKIKLL